MTKSPRVPRLLLVSKNIDYFISHRLSFVRFLKSKNIDLHVAGAANPPAEALEQLGAPFHPLPLQAHGVNPFHEAACLGAFHRLYRELKPDLVHHFTIKPMLYGSIAARRAGVAAVVNSVTGLGYIFTGDGLKPRLLRGPVKLAYKAAFRRDHRFIFQNPDNLDFFTAHFIRPDQATLIRGSGADPEAYRFLPEPEGVPLIVLPSRLLLDKGVREFMQAAEILKMENVPARMALVGEPEPNNPASVTEAEIKRYADAGLIERWGYRKDMPAVYAAANAVCLPSFYGEGVPRALIEAAMSGRAVVTTDMPGCREIVRHGYNGLLVAPRDAVSLARALKQLIQDPQARRQMGANGRSLAVSQFSEQKVMGETWRVYEELMGNKNGRSIEKNVA